MEARYAVAGACVLALLAVKPAPAGFKPEAPDFQVNAYTTGVQTGQPGRAVARSADGTFVVVWTDDGYFSDGRDGDDLGVFARRFDATGAPLGAGIQVNSYTTHSQHSASVSALPGGGFVVVWQSGDQLSTQDGSGAGVFGRLFDNTGTPASAEFQVNSYTSRGQRSPDVAAALDGRFAVTWVDDGYIVDGRDKDGAGIYARRFDETATPLGDDFRVNTYTRYGQDNPSISTRNDFQFVIVWDSEEQDGSGTGVFGQLVDALGNPLLEEFAVNTVTALNQRRPDVAMRPANGIFVVTWESATGGASGDDVFFQRFAADAGLAGGQIRANDYTTSGQLNAAIRREDDGRFVIVWDSFGQDGSDFGVFGKRYAINGVALGTEFQANSYTTGSQFAGTAVSSDGAGNFIVAWSDDTQEADREGTFARLFCDDDDNDTACDLVDICANNDDFVDTDTDTVPDGCDVCPGFDDFLDADTDTVPDGCDVCPGFNDLDDPDNDDIPTACDVCPRDALDDFDGDGWCRGTGFNPPKVGDQDNCPVDANPGQEDADLDNVGDACDACPGFPDQQDPDGDGIASGCDPCPLDNSNSPPPPRVDDQDGDGVCEEDDFNPPKTGKNDNCPDDPNPGQEDTDGDGNGDACDLCPGFDDTLDADADGVPDSCDPCPLDNRIAPPRSDDEDADGVCTTSGFNPPKIGDLDNCPVDANPGQEDADGDGIGDACDTCTNVGDAQTSTMTTLFKLKGANSETPLDDRLVARGALTLPMGGVFADLDPPTKPVSISIESVSGNVRYAFQLPTQAFAGKGTRGWRASESGRRWDYLDRTDIPEAGMQRLLLVQAGTPGMVRYKIKNRGGGIAVVTGDDPIRLLVDVGDAGAGECSEVVFGPGDCRFRSFNNLLCRQ